MLQTNNQLQFRTWYWTGYHFSQSFIHRYTNNMKKGPCTWNMCWIRSNCLFYWSVLNILPSLQNLLFSDWQYGWEEFQRSHILDNFQVESSMPAKIIQTCFILVPMNCSNFLMLRVLWEGEGIAMFNLLDSSRMSAKVWLLSHLRFLPKLSGYLQHFVHTSQGHNST